MKWTAIIPARVGGPRKTRLSDCLSAAQRERLSDELLAHVAHVVGAHPRIDRTVVLSPVRPRDFHCEWRVDNGRGINAELAAVRLQLQPEGLLVVLADLPSLDRGDIDALIDAADETGIALAPDHLETGTNAIAIHHSRSFRFAFGPESLCAHLLAADGRTGFVRRAGLACDVDRPEDLVRAASTGVLARSELDLGNLAQETAKLRL